MKNPKLPEITKEAIEEAIKSGALYEILKKSEEKTEKPYFHCEICRDTGREAVYGGPDRPCPVCGPRY